MGLRIFLIFGVLIVAGVIVPTQNAVAQVLLPGYNGLTGHIGAWPEQPPPTPGGQYRMDGWGVSFYSSVYPVKPGLDDWTQLGWGTWMTANAYEDANGDWNPVPDESEFCSPGAAVPSLFQSIEGGVGTWGNVQYPIALPMYMIGATADCYNLMIGGPAYRAGGDTALDGEELYFAQLSNRLLVPPGPMLFESPTQPALFGTGWIALPIIPANASPYGIPTGPNNWTLFFNSANFKGPLGFLTPAFWTSLAHDPDNSGDSVGYGFDSRTNWGKAVALEVGFTNAFSATDGQGKAYRRVPRLTFGINANNEALLMQDYKSYYKGAIWGAVEGWVNGGPAPTNMDAAAIWDAAMTSPDGGLQMIDSDTIGIDYGTTLESAVFGTGGGGSTFGLKWDGTLEAGVLPEYYEHIDGVWTPVAAAQVPAETTLIEQVFPKMSVGTTPTLDTTPGSPWEESGWAAGPFSVALGNGTVVDYVWYHFIDQPALARLPLSVAVKTKLQAWAESVHQTGVNGLTIPPPSSGQLASLDAGQLVTPPPGLGQGYVPIAIAMRFAPMIFSSGFEGEQ